METKVSSKEKEESKETATIEVVIFFPAILLGYFYGKLCRWFRIGKMIGDEL